MRYRKLGKTGLSVSEIGCGTWGMGGDLWLDGTDAQSMAALLRAIELGVNFIDTALIYGVGHSERLVGQALRKCRSSVYIASKIPPKNRLWPAPAGIPIEDVFPPEYMIECTEQSLRNLDVEAIDLQQLHVWDPKWLDREEWKRAFQDLKQAGKIKSAGVSVNDYQPDTAVELAASGLIDSLQVIYNIFDQAAAERLFPVAQQHNIGIMARVPLDEGSLTGKITVDTQFAPGDFRARYFRGDRKREVAERVAALVQDLGIESSQLPEIALRFCLSHPAVSTVIPGMRRPHHAEMNCAAAELGPLPAEILTILKRHSWQRSFYGRD